MFQQFLARAAGFGVLAAALFLTSTASDAATVDCDRGCLRQVLDTYLNGVFKHDPAAAGLAESYYATENTVMTLKGDGAWKNITGYGDLQRRLFDTYNHAAAYLGLLKRDGKNQVVSVRIKVDSRRKVSEAEWIFGLDGAGGEGKANPEALIKNPPPEATLPVSERSSRFILKSLANAYYQAVKEHDGSWVPHTDDCVRIENGVGGSAAPTEPAVNSRCLDNFARWRLLTKDVALRRFPVVDDEAGVVMGVASFERYPGSDHRGLVGQEYFVVRDGKVAGIWHFIYFLPLGSPSTTGWENRVDSE